MAGNIQPKIYTSAFIDTMYRYPILQKENVDMEEVKCTIKPKILMEEELFYIQNAGFCGNALFWWGKDMSGYVTDIRKAGRYTELQARRICTRKEDTAWPCSYIDNLTEAQKLIIDCQYPDPAKIKTWN